MHITAINSNPEFTSAVAWKSQNALVFIQARMPLFNWKPKQNSIQFDHHLIEMLDFVVMNEPTAEEGATEHQEHIRQDGTQ